MQGDLQLVRQYMGHIHIITSILHYYYHHYQSCIQLTCKVTIEVIIFFHLEEKKKIVVKLGE